MNRSFKFLNMTQFLTALNDNILRFLVVFFLIDTLGSEKTGLITSLAGAVFVIPFLLFSSYAGQMADRYSKQRIILGVKAAEVGIMACAFLSFSFANIYLAFTSLFLMGLHSTVLGPAKLGIIPELVEKKDLVKANSWVSSFTFVAIILGTFLATALTELTGKNFPVASLFSVLIAISGGILSLFISKTPSANHVFVPSFFLKEIRNNLRNTRLTPFLSSAVFSSGYFLFIGGFIQLNILPFGIEFLGITDVQSGYLFLITALGIGLGSFLVAKISGSSLKVILTPLGGLGISLSFFFLYLFPSSLALTIFLLLLQGVFGGFFLVPMDTFIQSASPDSKRGQMVATSNFLGFLGVLVASCLVFVLHQFHIPSSAGFLLLSILTAFVSLFLFRSQRSLKS